jgi:hypothetical protein
MTGFLGARAVAQVQQSRDSAENAQVSQYERAKVPESASAAAATSGPFESIDADGQPHDAARTATYDDARHHSHDLE